MEFDVDMGLCKCPKRQVTNQFCFEHRVNVCEHCMVQSHPKCIIQSYLQWLRDSDYASYCTLCGNSLERGECIRLICYHIFHWNCLNERQASLSINITPCGHTCPICNEEIFPTTNLISPVADALKIHLARVNWGRNGLGLALFSKASTNLKATYAAPIFHKSKNLLNSVSDAAEQQNFTGESIADDAYSSVGMSTHVYNDPHSMLLINALSSGESHGSIRRPLQSRQQTIDVTYNDEMKHRRRTPAEIILRLSRRFYVPSSRSPWRRPWVVALISCLTFVTIVFILATLARQAQESMDKNWENPNPKPNTHYE